MSAAEISMEDRGQQDDAVKVLVRIKPMFDKGRTCVHKISTQNLVWGPEQQLFSFDQVSGQDSMQPEIFEVAGVPLVEKCLEGFNCCVFTYGQTGSGKTYTMWGNLPKAKSPEIMPFEAGLIPRMFSLLFRRLGEEQAKRGSAKFTTRCSIVEIYNETITDLLNLESGNLPIRESKKDGIYIEGVVERRINCVGDVLDLINEGNGNRRVAETNMNRESSRSHCVLICTVTCKTTDENGIVTATTSRLNLVDLAGSERQKATQAKGDRLKEACGINKSLSTLGHVILTLAEQQQGKERHVPYRDSKLTFLLQDSLGGNSKTVMIACISPSVPNMEETLSTLRFARGAKNIKNKAVVNESCGGDVMALRAEITRLKLELAKYKDAETKRSSTPLSTEELPNSARSSGEISSTGSMSNLTMDMEELQKELHCLRVENRKLKRMRDQLMEEKSLVLEDSILLAAQLTAARLELEIAREEGTRAVQKVKRQEADIIRQLTRELQLCKASQSDNDTSDHTRTIMARARQRSMKIVGRKSSSVDWDATPYNVEDKARELVKQLTVKREQDCVVEEGGVTDRSDPSDRSSELELPGTPYGHGQRLKRTMSRSDNGNLSGHLDLSASSENSSGSGEFAFKAAGLDLGKVGGPALQEGGEEKEIEVGLLNGGVLENGAKDEEMNGEIGVEGAPVEEIKDQEFAVPEERPEELPEEVVLEKETEEEEEAILEEELVENGAQEMEKALQDSPFDKTEDEVSLGEESPEEVAVLEEALGEDNAQDGEKPVQDSPSDQDSPSHQNENEVSLGEVECPVVEGNDLVANEEEPAEEVAVLEKALVEDNVQEMVSGEKAVQDAPFDKNENEVSLEEVVEGNDLVANEEEAPVLEEVLIEDDTQEMVSGEEAVQDTPADKNETEVPLEEIKDPVVEGNDLVANEGEEKAGEAKEVNLEDQIEDPKDQESESQDQNLDPKEPELEPAAEEEIVESVARAHPTEETNLEENNPGNGDLVGREAELEQDDTESHVDQADQDSGMQADEQKEDEGDVEKTALDTPVVENGVLMPDGKATGEGEEAKEVQEEVLVGELDLAVDCLVSLDICIEHGMEHCKVIVNLPLGGSKQGPLDKEIAEIEADSNRAANNAQ